MSVHVGFVDMCAVKVPLSCFTPCPYISYYLKNNQVSDEPNKTEDDAASQEEEGNQSK